MNQRQLQINLRTCSVDTFEWFDAGARVFLDSRPNNSSLDLVDFDRRIFHVDDVDGSHAKHHAKSHVRQIYEKGHHYSTWSQAVKRLTLPHHDNDADFWTE